MSVVFELYQQAFRKISQNGGDRGPLFDRGVLSVFDEVERTGSFKPIPWVGLVGAALALRDQGVQILEPDEIVAVERYVKESGMSLDALDLYLRGVISAESVLSRFAAKL